MINIKCFKLCELIDFEFVGLREVTKKQYEIQIINMERCHFISLNHLE